MGPIGDIRWLGSDGRDTLGEGYAYAEMSTLPLIQDNNGDIRFRVAVANSGTVHFSPEGHVTLREANTGTESM